MNDLFSEKKYFQSSINIYYPRNIQIRRKVFDFEELLSSKYKIPAVTVPIPDNFSPEFPRITFISNQEHSKIKISQVNTELLVIYTDDYIHDFKKCINYLKERFSILFPAILNICKNRIYYIGLTTTIHFPIDKEYYNDLKIYLIKAFLGEKNINQSLYDFYIKYSSVKDNIYFINYNMRNYQIFKSKEGEQKDIFSLKDMEQISQGTEILLDINNRKQFNDNKNYELKDDIFDDLINIISNIINTKLEKILKTGKIELC